MSSSSVASDLDQTLDMRQRRGTKIDALRQGVIGGHLFDIFQDICHAWI